MRSSSLLFLSIMAAALSACGDDQPVKVPPPAPHLDAPTALRAVERTPSSIKLAWEGPAEAQRFELERRLSDSTFAPLADIAPLEGGGTEYADSGLAARSKFGYRVRAVNELATSDWSDTLAARTGLATPLLVSVTALDPYNAEVRWTYTPPSSSIEIDTRRVRGEWTVAAIVSATNDSYVAHSAETYVDLQYRLRAIEESDTSSWSDVGSTHLDLYSYGPDGTLERLRHGYARMDDADYPLLLAPDFAFRYTRDDLLAHPHWRLSSRAGLERGFFHALISDPRRMSFHLSFEWDDAEPVTDDDLAWNATLKVKVHDIELDLRTSTEGGTAREFSISGGSATLFLRNDDVWFGGYPRWQLTEWRDERGDAQPAESDSWGELHQFYAPDTLDVSHPISVLPPGDGHPILPPDGTGCGTLAINSDGSYESAYAWRPGAVVAPHYGAFAECFPAPSGNCACSVTLDLTRTSDTIPVPIDVIVYEDAGGVPGPVVCYLPGVSVGPIEIWPNVSRVVIPMDACVFDGDIWVAFWGSWDTSGAGYYIGADLDGGLGGCAMTNVYPFLGMPEGWQRVDDIFGPTRALGIGCEIAVCPPVDDKR